MRLLPVLLDRVHSVEWADHYNTVEDMTYSAGDAVFNGLVRLKPGTLDFDNLEGDLAESWEISKDVLVYTSRCSIHL